MKLNEKQLQQVDAQVKRLLKSGSFYGEVYRKAGISGVNSQEDFEKLPFSSKDDLRNAYPLGIQAVPEEEVVENSFFIGNDRKAGYYSLYCQGCGRLGNYVCPLLRNSGNYE